MNHTCAPARPQGVFCSTCGRVTDRAGLKKVGQALHPFTGTASLNQNVQTFWETGDASVFEPKP